MIGTRLFAAISLAAFVFAAAGTLRLAIAESLWRTGSLAAGGWPMSVGNSSYYEELAVREPALEVSALGRAVAANPRDSAAWIALGLAAERAGDTDRARYCLLQAEKVDRQYLPAWTAANFFFRQANDTEFWRAARQAAAMFYDDPAPLIDLADHRELKAVAALERLGDTPRLERGYLHFLIAEGRWQEAQEVGGRLALRRGAQDRELLLALTDRLIVAGRAEAALAIARARAGAVTNGDFRIEPSGHGFDWRMTAPPGGAAHWESGRVRFWLARSTPDACALLDQWVVLDPGGYRLRFEYRIDGLAEETGLHWTAVRHGIEEASGPVLTRAAGLAAGDRKTDWSFGVKKPGFYQLRLVYSRVPGTTHIEGRAEFASVELKNL